MNVKIDLETNTIVITLPIEPRPSATGKTTVIAGTGGFAPTTESYEGQPVTILVNVIIPNK